MTLVLTIHVFQDQFQPVKVSRMENAPRLLRDISCSMEWQSLIEIVDPTIKEVLLETKEKAKFIPNVMRVLSRRPEEFKAFFYYHDVLMKSERGDKYLS